MNELTFEEIPWEEEVIRLPVSKSEMNRLLVLRYLEGEPLPQTDPTWPDDVRLLHAALTGKEPEIDLELAGTAMRFLTACLAMQEGRETILTGNARMRQRPMGELVRALVFLGADITYLAVPGHAPLRIRGRSLRSGVVEVDGTVSSQFISALMLIGPFLPDGLELRWKELVSAPYVTLTARLMQRAGYSIEPEDRGVKIPPRRNRMEPVAPSPDWSAAAFFYQALALRQNGSLLLKGLDLDSPQGDRLMADWFSHLGVVSEQRPEGVLIRRKTTWSLPGQVHWGAGSTPDLVPAAALTLAGLGIPATLTGLSTLAGKESNRILALEEVLGQSGLNASSTASSLEFHGHWSVSRKTYSTYGDHRMAMALGMMALLGPLRLDHPEVVSKSFPDFWETMAALGFRFSI